MFNQFLVSFSWILFLEIKMEEITEKTTTKRSTMSMFFVAYRLFSTRCFSCIFFVWFWYMCVDGVRD